MNELLLQGLSELGLDVSRAETLERFSSLLLEKNEVMNLTAITQSEATMAAYLQNSFFSAGYLMAASIVALKCLNLVPDLAAWMIPEGDTAFSTRNFGEGVAQQAKMTATGAMQKIM